MQIKKAVIAVAGYGTRFLPATKAIPKELLPVINIPILEMLVRELSEAGISEILMIISRGKESIIKHFDRNFEMECVLNKNKKDEYYKLITQQLDYACIQYVFQKEALGFADAVSYSKRFVGKDDFVLCVGDEVFFGNQKSLTTQLIECYYAYNTPCIALSEVPVKETHLYGIIDGCRDNQIVEVNRLVEKPVNNPPSNLANIGRYVMSCEIFDIIEKFKDSDNEINFIDCLNMLLETRRLTGIIADGTRFDTGSRSGYVKANIFAGLHDKELKDDILQFIKGVLNK